MQGGSTTNVEEEEFDKIADVTFGGLQGQSANQKGGSNEEFSDEHNVYRDDICHTLKEGRLAALEDKEHHQSSNALSHLHCPLVQLKL